MKSLFTAILITIGSLCYGQLRDTSYFDGCNTVTIANGVKMITTLACGGSIEIDFDTDTITTSRFIEDSIGNGYEIQYRYANDDIAKAIKDIDHAHYISNVFIIQFKGNKQKTIFSNIKAIYSPVECSSDNRELWLKRLYEYLKTKK